MEIFTLLETLEDIMEKSRNVPFSTKCVVDRDEMIDLCKDLDIMGIPSFIGYDNGKETGRFVSKLRKTKDQIEAFIESL